MSKIKELPRRATIAWSTTALHSDLIAAGTAAGTIGLDFDTSSTLEIYSLDILNDSSNLVLAGKTTANNRFHKLAWGQGSGTDRTHGIIAGGMDNGAVTFFDPAKIVAGKDDDAVLGSAQKHQGAVHALDFNPYQHNLLASGASDSEILIWDLSNPSTPTVYTPGTKPQQSSDVSCVAWNKKVPHILASASHSGVTFIWDLKAKRSIINFSDATKSQVRAISWNPTEATQVLTASEDDASPILQLWDLRNIYTPIRKYVGHTRGIWGVSWCPFDNSLIVSCGKDNRTLCWHTETAEVLCEVESGGVDSGTWNVDVQWSPRVPAVMSTASLEGKVSIYALQDVGEKSPATSSSSFLPPTARPVPRHAPSWLRRPVGVAFGFGGNIASFSYNAASKKSTLKIRKVITEKDLLDRSERLEHVISTGTFETFCDEKIASSTMEGEEKYTWKFLKVLFDKEGRHKILDYLGFDEAQTVAAIHDIQDKLPGTTDDETSAKEGDKTAEVEPAAETPRSPVTEHEQQEHEVPSQDKDVAGLFGTAGEAFPSFSFEQQQQQQHVPVKSATKPPTRLAQPIGLSTSAEGPESAITKALLIGNFAVAVNICVKLDRMADALVLAACGGEELWKQTQARYFAVQKSPYSGIMASIVRNDLEQLVENADLADWKAALAILCTYAKGSELPKLATILGDRLDTEAHNIKAATLCYICAGSIDKTVNVWIRTTKEHKDPHQALQDLIEKVSIFRHAVNAADNDLDELLARKYCEYAEILASQGRLPASLRYLSFLSEPKYSHTGGAILLDRVFYSYKPAGQAPPPSPFTKVEVGVYKNTPVAGISQTAPQQYPQQYPQQQLQQQYGHAPSQAPYSTTGPQFAGQTGIPQSAFSTPPVQPVAQPPAHQVHAHQSGPVHTLTSPFGHTTSAGAPPLPGAQPPITPPIIPPPFVTGPPLGPPTSFAQHVSPAPVSVMPHQGPPTGAPPPFTPIGLSGAPSSAQPPSPQYSRNEPPQSQTTPFTHSVSAPPPTHGAPPTASAAPTSQPHVPESKQSTSSNPDVRYVVESFNGAIQSQVPGRDKAKRDDMAKRLPSLITALDKGDVKGEAIQLLVQICRACEAGDHAGANKNLQDLGTSNLLAAKDLIGVKRFVELSKR